MVYPDTEDALLVNRPYHHYGYGVQGGWLLFSALLGDICDEDERQTGLRQEGIYSAVMDFVTNALGHLVGAAYMLEFSLRCRHGS